MWGLGVQLEGLGALLKSVSAIGHISREGEFVVRDRPCDNTGESRLFCVTDFAELCNSKEVKIVKAGRREQRNSCGSRYAAKKA